MHQVGNYCIVYCKFVVFDGDTYASINMSQHNGMDPVKTVVSSCMHKIMKLLCIKRLEF